ncbi:MAG: phosphatidylserine decarboxylase family protein [Bacteroidetes bacterium]|jgi:phosphatidylserine decarboxylase|nr:phosphatidylserine decarboxylase family protein [Bacteroidota bacterium]
MRIHKEGYLIIFIMLLAILTIALIINLLFPVQTIIHYFLYFIGLIFFILIIRFFRQPNRTIEINDNNILSGADGKVVVIEEVEEKEYFKDKRIQVSVFMSALNVHVNWYPISGNIIYFKHHPGKYFAAYHPKSSSENERTSFVIENSKHQSVLSRQIAGLLARRIVSNAEVGKHVVQGDEIGIIKFGSRFDLLLPVDAKIKVKLRQEVRGGKTVIAEFS